MYILKLVSPIYLALHFWNMYKTDVGTGAYKYFTVLLYLFFCSMSSVSITVKKFCF